MNLYSPYTLFVLLVAGMGWLILLAMVCGKWPIGKEDNKETNTK